VKRIHITLTFTSLIIFAFLISFFAINTQELASEGIAAHSAIGYTNGTYNYNTQEQATDGIIAYGTVGDTSGAPWRLYYDGTVVVDSGFINIYWRSTISPWRDYSENINKIVFTGPITAGTYLRHLFYSLTNLTSIEGLHYFDTSNVTEMHSMFANTNSLTSLDLSGWDTSNVNQMFNIFGHARNLTSLDLSGWDAHNVTSARAMFAGMDFLNYLALGENFSFVQDLELPPIPQSNYYTGYWQNIGQGTYYNPQGEFVFTSEELIQYENAHIASGNIWVWQRTDVQRPEGPLALRVGTVNGGAPWRLYADGTLVVDSGFVYHSPSGRNPRSPWDRFNNHINKVIFSGPVTAGSSLKALFGGLQYVTDIEGLHYLDTSSVSDMSWIFFGMASLESLDLSTLDVSNVTSMEAMFSGATSLVTLDISGWDVSNVLCMSRMFGGVRSMSDFDLSNWDVSNVTNMSSMFGGTTMTSLDLSGWDTRNVEDMGQMFYRTRLKQLVLGQYFKFASGDYFWNRNAHLPRVPLDDDFAGRWQNVGRGTPDNPQGRFVFSCTQLMSNFDGAIHADTWVWQRAGSRRRPTLSGTSPKQPPFYASETQAILEERVCLWQYVGEISHYRGSVYPDDVPKLMIITSTDELAAFVELNTTHIGFDGEDRVYSYIADIDKYDEAFFAVNFLAFISTGEGSGSNRQEVTAIYTTERSDTVYIEITSTRPGGGLFGTADFMFWQHRIELDRSLSGNEIIVTRPRRYIQGLQLLCHCSVYRASTTRRRNEFPSLVRINSVDELLYYYERNRAFLPEEMIDRVFRNMYFDATFFRMQSLLFLRLEESCGLNTLEITSLCSPSSSGVVDVQITRTVSEGGTADMRYWYFVFRDSNEIYEPSTVALVINE